MAYKYEEIATHLRSAIQDGQFAPGALLPDQNQLAQEFDTTRITIRKAVQLLIIEGLVYSKRGAGTFVRKDYGSHNDQALTSEVDRPLGTTRTYSGKQVTSRVMSLDARLPSSEEQKKLLITATDPVYVIRRVRFVDGKVYAFEHTIMPTAIAQITREVLQGSVYGYLEKNYHLTISGSHRIISAAKANQDDVEALDAKLNDPVLVINQVSYTDDGTPFEYSETHFPYQTSTVIADVQLH